MQTLPKDPAEKIDMPIDWSRRLESGETIDASEWEVEDASEEEETPLVQSESPAATNSGGITNAFFEGGTLGAVYIVKNSITTNQGRELVRRRKVIIQPK